MFRQRVEGNDFHGYGVQDFLEVDSRFGTRADLVELVRAAHAAGIRVILDIIFNHTGFNWVYDAAETGNAFKPKYITDQYRSLFPKNGFGGVITDPRQSLGNDDYVWPKDLQFIENYTQGRQREVSAPGTSATPEPEHKRTNFEVLRDVAVERAETLGADNLHLSVLDRPDRLRRAAYRYAETCGRRGRAQLLRRREGIRGVDRQEQPPPAWRDRGWETMRRSFI